MGLFSFKNFDNVRLKATYNIEIGDHSFEPGETIALFDKIQIAGIDDIIQRVTANGGFDNRARVFWETVREEQLTFAQGVFNKIQFELLSNAQIINKAKDDIVLVTKREHLESNVNCQFELSHTPYDKLFVYDARDGKKITYSREDRIVTIATTYTDVIVDYNYNYSNDSTVFLLGSKYFNGFMELEGTTKIKDDESGNVVTGVIRIPHLKLMSDLSIRLGAQANPVVANFSATGIPVGSRGNSYVSEFYILNDDIDSDL